MKKKRTRKTAAVDKAIGGKIRSRRQTLGMPLRELADALDLTFQQVQKYETGASSISASRLLSVAEVLNCRPSALLPPDEARARGR